MMKIELKDRPITLTKDLNTILLSWENILDENCCENLEFLLYIQEEGKWKALYRGPKITYKVKNLTPQTVYKFQLRLFQDEIEIGDVIFKSATEFEPYRVHHITRAISQGKTSLLRKIVNQRPILLETPNKQGKTPLVFVIERNDLSTTTFLITLGANINSPLLGNLRTPLMIALFRGYLQIASLLIDKGADVNQTDCNGLTPFHYAVDSGLLISVKFAVEQKLNINAKDNQGWTPLLRAVILESDDKIVKFLIKNGADTNIRDKNGFGFSEHCKMTKRYRWCKINLEDIKMNFHLEEGVN
nr:fibronectin type 3 and ankyrin repeat domains 1 protein [Onthophagus taurus]